jgi:hypothetical protein
LTVKKLLLASSGAALLILAIWLLTRERGSDQERLRRIVDEMAEAASRRDVGDILEHVSESFTGSSRGTARKEDLRRLLLGVLLREGWSRVYVFDASFTPKDAEYLGSIVFVGAQGEGLPDDPRKLAPERLQAYRVTARFVREDETFRILEADYESLASGLLSAPR